MRYTVIVPVYNGQDTIEECLKHLLNQKGATYGKDYTIIVVDDGSTDGTRQIVENFPVVLICLPTNQGRIIARLTGAKCARTDRILFVDSRVSLPYDTIGKLDDFDDYPAVIGELDSTATKYESAIHTVLYLIRRRYYGKEFFPAANDLTITQRNFRRAPKGTAVLLIDRNLFVELTPERTGRDVNDDTLLFHKLVFDHKIDLLRAGALVFQYSQRTDLRQFSSWLFHRGVRFSDFYLRPGGFFHIHFLLLVVVLAGLSSLVLLLGGVFFLAALAIGLDAALSLYLCENPKDFPRVFLWLPLVIVIFGSGVSAFWAKTLSGSLLSLFKYRN
ncbi:MAG TPA: glycosyltransferase family 2 protein [Syntrophobacteraceae bacterium]|nr:glycosyltransferase family 2 protein [Syntrophobacteraceae bacterium]